MQIIQKLNAKQDMYENKPVTIAFLGDSVTQGCFECYTKPGGDIENVYDYSSSYCTRVREMLNILYPCVQVNIINSGICGDQTPNGYARIERDILPYSPDLVVVSFGLNDAGNGMEGLEDYKEIIRKIISKLIVHGMEVIFLTQNYMNTEVSCLLTDPVLRAFSVGTMETQNNGTLKQYMAAARDVALACGAKVCDLYTMWEKWEKGGVDTTALLSNHINHPVRPLHSYMAMKLIETMFED